MNRKLTDKIIEISKTLIHRPECNFLHLTYIVKRNRIISIGWCKKKTHTQAFRTHKYPTTHAEVDAIINFPYPVKELRRCCLINVRLSKNRELKISKPCKYCSDFLNNFEINQIWYSTDQGFVKY